MLLLAAYVLASGRAATTWGSPSHEPLQVSSSLGQRVVGSLHVCHKQLMLLQGPDWG